MDIYNAINCIEIKEGRPYKFSFPRMGQKEEEIYEILELFKVEIKKIFAEQAKKYDEDQKKAEGAQEEKSNEASQIIKEEK